MLSRGHTTTNRLPHRRSDAHVAVSAVLDFLAVHARRKTAVVRAGADLVTSLVVHVFDIEGVDVAGEIAEIGLAAVEERMGVEDMYPRIVRRMLMSRSAPQPAMRKTPTGGTGRS